MAAMDSVALLALAELPEDLPATLAVIVGVHGSAYRRAGAARLTAPGRPPAGVVSGGCLEADLDLRASRAGGEGMLLRYDLRGGPEDLWGLAAGCNGALEIWLQPIPAGRPSAYRCAARWLAEGRTAVVTTVLSTGLQWAAADDGHTFGAPGPAVGQRVFVDHRAPAPSFLVFGRGPDAGPMADLAGRAGFRVRRAGDPDDLEGLLASAPPDAAVVMSHHFPGDRRALAALLAAGVPYVGVLGSRERTRRLLPEPWPPSVHAPLGLDIGADSPEEIALAAVAEALAVLRGRGAGHLRARAGRVHAPGPVVPS